jgi:hypothetical protein
MNNLRLKLLAGFLFFIQNADGQNEMPEMSPFELKEDIRYLTMNKAEIARWKEFKKTRVN